MKFLAITVYYNIGYVYYNRTEDEIYLDASGIVGKLRDIHKMRINPRARMDQLTSMGQPMRIPLKINDTNLQSIVKRIFNKG